MFYTGMTTIKGMIADWWFYRSPCTASAMRPVYATNRWPSQIWTDLTGDLQVDDLYKCSEKKTTNCKASHQLTPKSICDGHLFMLLCGYDIHRTSFYCMANQFKSPLTMCPSKWQISSNVHDLHTLKDISMRKSCIYSFQNWRKADDYPKVAVLNVMQMVLMLIKHEVAPLVNFWHIAVAHKFVCG